MGTMLEELYEWACMRRQPCGPKQAEYLDIMEDRENKLMEMLNETGKSLFRDFTDARDGTSDANACAYFAKGFVIGSLLADEIHRIKAEIFGE